MIAPTNGRRAPSTTSVGARADASADERDDVDDQPAETHRRDQQAQRAEDEAGDQQALGHAPQPTLYSSPMRFGGQYVANALPMIQSRGTGPQKRLSSDEPRLSPIMK
jgi:hypothetical protein